MISLPSQQVQVPLNNRSSTVIGTAQQNLRLKKATQEFEAIFVNQLLKSMRSVSFDKKNDDGFGQAIMLEMADEAVSRQVAGTGALGIGELLYKRLSERLEGFGNSDQLSLPVVGAPLPFQRTDGELSAAVAGFRKFIDQAARKTGLSPRLIAAVIKQESGGDPHALSPAGAAGLMQLMPDTAVELGVRNRFDPAENIDGGSRYLRSLINRFGNLEHALAAYNAGPSRVEEYGGLPPFPETQKYVAEIVFALKSSK